MRPTGRGVAAAVTAAGCLLAGYQLHYTLLYAVGGGVIGALAIACFVVATAPQGTVVRRIEPAKVRRAEAAYGHISVSNPTRRSLPSAVAVDRIDGHDPIPVMLPAVPVKEMRRRVYDLPTQRRGIFAVGPLVIRYADPLGLVRRRTVASESEELWVQPRVYPVRHMPGGRGARHGQAQADTMFRGSTEFRSLREYVIGDDVKNLHWKSTARAGQLMVREFTDPWRPKMTILLDNRAGALAPDAFEEAVDVAASLHEAGLRNESVVTIEVTVPAAERARPDADRTTALLCTVDQRPGTEAAIDFGTSFSIVYITGSAYAADVALLATLRKRADAVLVIDMQPGQTAALGVPVVNARTASEAVTLWNAMVVR